MRQSNWYPCRPANRCARTLPITLTYDESIAGFRLELSTPVSVADVVEVYDQLVRDEHNLPNTPSLWDITRLDLGQIPVSDIRALPRALAGLANQRGDLYRAAVVTTRMRDYGLLRIYLSILKLIGTNMRLRLFDNLAAAENWIKEVSL